MTRGAFVSWVPRHGRSAGIAARLGLDERNVWEPGAGGLVGRYWRSWRSTVRALRRDRPTVVFVMQPPVPALLATRWALRSTPTRMAVDLHTGSFDDPRWRWSLPLVRRLIRERDIAIVTNTELVPRLSGIRGSTFVMHDVVDGPLATGEPAAWIAPLIGPGYILVPLAWAYDEPIAALLAAIRSQPDLTWVLTGTPPTDVAVDLPSNAVTPGFVSDEEYAQLLHHASVVCALTTEQSTMQRAGYEALANSKALVVSDTHVLRAYFGGHARLTAPEAEPIADAVRDAWRHRGEWERAMKDLRSRRHNEEAAAVAALERWVTGSGEETP